ncbi:MAG: hypothetical protein ACLRIS_19815 [Flavonifractor plautii]
MDLRTEEVHASSRRLAQVEEARIRSALELAQELDADYGAARRAAWPPWHKEALEGLSGRAGAGAATAKLQRSYDAAR